MSQSQRKSLGFGGQVDNGEFECLVPIDHRADRRIYPAGAKIRLDHLAPEQVERLVARGYVRRLPAAAQSEPPATE